jgi:hypothetical protein
LDKQDSICIESVTRLRGKVSSRFICECLDEKYKQKYRVENAKRQKSHNESLAALRYFIIAPFSDNMDATDRHENALAILY